MSWLLKCTTKVKNSINPMQLWHQNLLNMTYLLPKVKWVTNLPPRTDSYKFTSPIFKSLNHFIYAASIKIQKKLQKEDPTSPTSIYLPSLLHFSVTSRKTTYYYELILEDTGSCFFNHKFREDDRSHHQILYHFKTFESCIAYSKAIITKIITHEEYGNPNATHHLSFI